MLSPLQAFLMLQLWSALPKVATASAWTEQPLLEYPPRDLGAVASEADVCTNVGLDMLQADGSAADAVCQGPLHGFACPSDFAKRTLDCGDHHLRGSRGPDAPYNSGIGGGGFATIRTPEGTYEVVDFREQAPAAARPHMFVDAPKLSIFGGLASAVPGQIRGLEYIHKKYGKLPWRMVVEPSVRIANEGWVINEDFVQNVGWGLEFAGRPDFIHQVPTWAVDFAPNGTMLGLGERITRKRLGSTLERIAREGPDAFYTGAIAKTIVAALQADNGIMTMEDLASYSVNVTPTVNITYRGHTVHSCNAPCSGPVVLNTLKTLDGYSDLFVKGKTDLSYHRLIEAIKFAYSRRTKLGDPAFVGNVSTFVDRMLSEDLAAETRRKISDAKTHDAIYYNPDRSEISSDHGTSHMVAADASGLAFSITTTINLSFGSQLMIPETGIVMNNNMDGFSIPNVRNAFGYVPSPENYPGPGKRPLSSMSPLIVEAPGNASHFYLIGAEGGSRIITANVQNIINVLDRNMTSPMALVQPRVHTQLVPEYVEFEWPFENKTVAHLEGLGHNVTWVKPVLTAAQGIRRMPNGTFEAAAEPRQLNSGGYVASSRNNRFGITWLMQQLVGQYPS